MTRKLGALLLAMAIALGVSAPTVIAQTYPSKPIMLVVPFPAGGRTDLTGRVVAQFLRNELGQPVVVVNRPGASGVLGAKAVAGGNADGYTLGIFSTGFLTTQYTVPTPTNPREFEFIALINKDPAAVAVPVARGWKNLEEVVSWGRANPGKLRVGINPGSSAHVFAAAFARAANLDVVYVPFRGGGERAPALAGGHIDADFDIVAPLRPLSEAGKVRILAVAAERRVELYRDIATMREQGVDLVISSWHGVFAPRGTPPAVIAAVSAALEKVARNREFVEQMNKLLLGVHYLGSQNFARFFAGEDEVFKALIEKLGLHVAPGTTR